jgi:hypothetical protein
VAKQPWLKWFPSDWRGDPKLRLCSWEAGRLWFEMIGIMHEGEPYGHLRIEGRNLEAADLSAMLGQPAKKITAWLVDLERNGVFSRENGCILSRKMVRDEATRVARAEGGRKSIQNPKVPAPKDTLKDILKDTHIGYPQIPEARSQKPEPEKKKNNLCSLPADWVPNETHRDIAAKLPGILVSAEVENFKDHHTAKGSRFKDWDAAFRTWLRNAAKFAARRPPHDSPAAKTKDETPKQEGKRTGEWETVGGQRLLSEDEVKDRQVAGWRQDNIERATVIWQECANEVAETFTGTRGVFSEVAAKAMVNSRFRSRVIAEFLTPKLAAS